MYPKISVVMPFYNREKYIGQAVQSILDQTFTDFELILVDDGSIDQSRSIVESIASKDDRIHIIYNNINCGIARSRNIGMHKACANIIAVADSDDINMPDRFLVQYNYLQNHPDVSIVGTYAHIIDGNGDRTGESITYLTEPEMIAKTFFHLGPFLQPTTMFRKEKIISVGCYRDKYSLIDDMDLYFRLLYEGHKGSNIPQFLVEYRHHDSATGNFLREKRESMLELKKEMVSTYKPRLGIRDLMSMYIWHYLWLMVPEKKMLTFEKIIKKMIYP